MGKETKWLGHGLCHENAIKRVAVEHGDLLGCCGVRGRDWEFYVTGFPKQCSCLGPGNRYRFPRQSMFDGNFPDGCSTHVYVVC